MVTTFLKEHREAYKTLNLEWIENHFKVEKKDLDQLNSPEACLDEGGQIFFVIENGLAVATCALYKVRDNRFELAKMAVSPDCRGKGYGDLMMEAAEKWAKSQGANEILILSNTLLKPAIKLYHKHGFITVHLGPHPDYQRCNIELTKSLL